MQENTRLHLLEPKIRDVYYGKNGGETVKYLCIPANMTLSKLKADVKLGAQQFAGLADIAEEIAKEKAVDADARTKLVILKAANPELGRMAVAYLEGCAFQAEYPGMGDDDDDSEDGKIVYWGDFDDADASEDPEDTEEDEEDDDDDAFDSSGNDRCAVPIVEYNRLNEPERITEIGGDTSLQQALKNESRPREPFWYHSESPAILVEYYVHNTYWSAPQAMQPFDFQDQLLCLSGFPRIYLLVIDTRLESDLLEASARENTQRVDALIGMYRLLYVGKLDEVRTDQKTLHAYYRKVLEDAATEQGFEICRGVSKDRILKTIFSIHAADRCGAIVRCVHYVIAQHVGEGAPTKADWNNLLNIDFLQDRIGKQDPEKKSDAFEDHFLFREDVRGQFDRCIAALQIQKLRYQKLPREKLSPLHNTLLFVGAPGTGKTEGAKYFANMLFDAGLVPGNRFVSVTGTQLKGEYVGSTSPRVRAIVASGDVIFVDEVYSLMASDKQGRTDSYSKEALAELLLLMEDHPEKVFIFAGYGGPDGKSERDEMTRFLQENPGLRSRISMTVFFSSYAPEELVAITHHIAEEQDYLLDPEADPILLNYFKEKKTSGNDGNARDARSLVDAIRRQAVRRLRHSARGLHPDEMDKEQLALLTAADVKNAVREQLDGEEKLRGRGHAYGLPTERRDA